MNKNPNQQKGRSQADRILRHLQGGRGITSLQAFTKYDCMRLASRISDLKRKGYQISRRWITTPTGKYVVEYRMAK